MNTQQSLNTGMLISFKNECFYDLHEWRTLTAKSSDPGRKGRELVKRLTSFTR